MTEHRSSAGLVCLWFVASGHLNQDQDLNPVVLAHPSVEPLSDVLLHHNISETFGCRQSLMLDERVEPDDPGHLLIGADRF